MCYDILFELKVNNIANGGNDYFTSSGNSGVETSQLKDFRMRSRDSVIAEKMSDFAIPMKTDAEQGECFQSLLDEKDKKAPSSMQLAMADDNVS